MENKSIIGTNPVEYISNWINSIKDQSIKNQGRAINRMYDELAPLTMVDRPDVSKAYEILKEYCESVEGLYKAMNDDELINGKYEQEELFKNIGNISSAKEFDEIKLGEAVYPMPDHEPMLEPIPDPTPMPDYEPIPDPTPWPEPTPDPTPWPEPTPDPTPTIIQEEHHNDAVPDGIGGVYIYDFNREKYVFVPDKSVVISDGYFIESVEKEFDVDEEITAALVELKEIDEQLEEVKKENESGDELDE